jgi:hypothetical protein
MAARSPGFASVGAEFQCCDAARRAKPRFRKAPRLAPFLHDCALACLCLASVHMSSCSPCCERGRVESAPQTRHKGQEATEVQVQLARDRWDAARSQRARRVSWIAQPSAATHARRAFYLPHSPASLSLQPMAEEAGHAGHAGHSDSAFRSFLISEAARSSLEARLIACRKVRDRNRAAGASEYFAACSPAPHPDGDEIRTAGLCSCWPH